MKKIRLLLVFLFCAGLITFLCSCAGPQGEQGPKGEQGVQGEQGLAGQVGEAGADGETGKTAEFRIDNGYVQWKYTDEADTAWKTLYEYLPTVSDPSDPIPDGVPSAYITTMSDTDNYGLAGSYTQLFKKEIAVGDKVALTATVNDGYNFEGWYLSGECLSKDLTYEYIMTNYDVTIQAKYSYYTLSTESYSDEYGVAGTYTELTDKKVSVGDTVTLAATVNDGYNFDGWYINGECLSQELSYEYVMRAENESIEAVYSYYTITTSCNVGELLELHDIGSYTELTDKKVRVGDTVELLATVNDGYNFDGWYINGVLVSQDPTYTYIMKAENREIEASYSWYTLTTTGRVRLANGNWSYDAFIAGDYTAMFDQAISVGSTVTLTATANEGYNFEGWYINNVLISKEPTYVYTMEAENREIQANYSCYTVTTDGRVKHIDYSWEMDFAAGTYTQFNESCVSAGQTVTVTATVKDGYNFIGWFVGDFCVSEELTYTFVMGKANVELYASYNYCYLNTVAKFTAYPESWKTNYNHFDNYSLCIDTVYTRQNVSEGTQITLTAKEVVGYTFYAWTNGDGILCTDKEFTFIMPEEDFNIQVIYEITESYM